MKRSKKGNAVYAGIGFWRQSDGSIHLTIKGATGAHVTINADPAKRNGHPTLFSRLDKLLKEAKTPPTFTLKFLDGERRVVSTKKLGPPSK